MHTTVILDFSPIHIINLTINYTVAVKHLYRYNTNDSRFMDDDVTPDYFFPSNIDLEGSNISIVNRQKTSFMKIDIIHANTFSIKTFVINEETTTVRPAFVHRYVGKQNFSKRISISKFALNNSATVQGKGKSYAKFREMFSEESSFRSDIENIMTLSYSQSFENVNKFM